MHCELTIGHAELTPDELRRLLVATFGPHDARALEESPFYRGQGRAWRGQPVYASQRPGYRVICMPSWNRELQVFVEVDRGDLRRSAERAWDAIRTALRSYRPRVLSAEMLDFGTGQTVLTAQTGLRTELRRREVWQTLATGLVTIVLVVFGLVGFARDARGELLAGAAPGLATAVVTLVLAARDASARRLRWPE